MIKVIETATTFEIQDMMPTGRRVFFAGLALIPLLAPYELLLRPRWTDYFNLVFLFFLVVSLGALVVSELLCWAAVAGLSQVLRLDRSTGMLTYLSGAPVVRWQKEQHPLSAIKSLELEVHDWSDGSPSYSLAVALKDDRTFIIGSSWSKEKIEHLRTRAAAYLKAIS